MTITKQSIEILSIYWFSNRQKQFAAWNCLNWFYYCSKKGVSFPYNRYIVSTAHSLPPSWHSPPLPILFFFQSYLLDFLTTICSQIVNFGMKRILKKIVEKSAVPPFYKKKYFSTCFMASDMKFNQRGYEILKCQNRKTFGLLQHTGIFWHLLFIKEKLTIFFTVNAT